MVYLLHLELILIAYWICRHMSEQNGGIFIGLKQKQLLSWIALVKDIFDGYTW